MLEEIEVMMCWFVEEGSNNGRPQIDLGDLV